MIFARYITCIMEAIEQFFQPLSAPWISYSRLTYNTGYLCGMHRHPEWQLTVCLDGLFTFELEQAKINLPEGGWILLSPDCFHSSINEVIPSTAQQIFFPYFPPDMLPEFADSFNFLRNYHAEGTCSLDECFRLDSLFQNRKQKDILHPKSRENMLVMNFICHVLSSQTRDPEGSENERRILQAIIHMDKHFAEPVTLQDIAAIAELSPSHFITLFQKKMKTSPVHYLNNIRLTHAQSLLMNGATIAEVVEATGFSSPQYFCRFFKKKLGMSPGVYRKKRTPKL